MFNEELYHHGIEGQKWGKQNGPPYPLSRAEHRRVIRSAKAAKKRNLSYDKAKRNARKLTDDDLDLALERLRREKEYAQLVAKPGTEPWKKEEKAVSKVNRKQYEESGKGNKGSTFLGGLALDVLKKLTLGMVDNYTNDHKRRMDDIRKEEQEIKKQANKKAEDWQKYVKNIPYKQTYTIPHNQPEDFAKRYASEVKNNSNIKPYILDDLSTAKMEVITAADIKRR